MRSHLSFAVLSILLFCFNSEMNAAYTCSVVADGTIECANAAQDSSLDVLFGKDCTFSKSILLDSLEFLNKSLGVSNTETIATVISFCTDTSRVFYTKNNGSIDGIDYLNGQHRIIEISYPNDSIAKDHFISFRNTDFQKELDDFYWRIKPGFTALTKGNTISLFLVNDCGDPKSAELRSYLKSHYDLDQIFIVRCGLNKQ